MSERYDLNPLGIRVAPLVPMKSVKPLYKRPKIRRSCDQLISSSIYDRNESVVHMILDRSM